LPTARPLLGASRYVPAFVGRSRALLKRAAPGVVYVDLGPSARLPFARIVSGGLILTPQTFHSFISLYLAESAALHPTRLPSPRSQLACSCPLALTLSSAPHRGRPLCHACSHLRSWPVNMRQALLQLLSATSSASTSPFHGARRPSGRLYCACGELQGLPAPGRH
jgi:hypothetical protein